MGDFTGFKFDGVHSSELGIVRVSDGDRYKDNSSPEIKDINAEVPGMDGEYYFGTNFGTREFSIEIAYDSVTEVQLRIIRRIFSQKKICELVFDEEPYKKYLVKITNPIELNYVCFDEQERVKADTERNGVRRDREKDQYEPGGEVNINIDVLPEDTITYTLTHIPNGPVIISPDTGYTHEEGTYTYIFSNSGTDSIKFSLSYTYDATYEAAWEQVTPWEYTGKTRRVYKGDGSIELVAYYPFAKAVDKELPEDSDEWAAASGILSHEQRENYRIDTVVDEDLPEEFSTYNACIPVYNPGDSSTGFRLYVPYSSGTESYSLMIQVPNGSSFINIENLVKEDNNINENGFIINTENNLIEGVIYQDEQFITTGNIYNKYIESGTFFKIPMTVELDGIINPNGTTQRTYRLYIKGSGISTWTDLEIDYTYLYY